MLNLRRVEQALTALRSSRDPAGRIEELEVGLAALGGAGARLTARSRGRRSSPSAAGRVYRPFGVVSLPRCGCVWPRPVARSRAAGPCDLRGHPWQVGALLGPRQVVPERSLEAFGAEVVDVLRGLALHHVLCGLSPGPGVPSDEGEVAWVLDGATGALRLATPLAIALAQAQASELAPGDEPLAALLSTVARQVFERRASRRLVAPTRDGSVSVQARLLDDAGRWVVLFAARRGRRHPGPAALVALGLTPREAEVAERIALGETNREVAQALRLSPATVKCHVAHIYGKTGLQGRTELAGLLLGGVLPPWAHASLRPGRARGATGHGAR